MSREAVYSKDELAELRASARFGRPLECPRCRTSLLSRPVVQSREVAYVRTRTWWICPECRRSAVLDADSGETRGSRGDGPAR